VRFRNSVEFRSSSRCSLRRQGSTAIQPNGQMIASLLYALARIMAEVISTWRADEAKLQAEAVALRRQVQVLERRRSLGWSPTGLIRDHLFDRSGRGSPSG
jgi:hypothetical protein